MYGLLGEIIFTRWIMVGKLVRCKTKFKYQQKPGINTPGPGVFPARTFSLYSLFTAADET